jgi:biopolymer transport protein TolR
MADINIIPFVDVALVLLVIFMVTAPMLYRGFDLTLPESKTDSTYKPQDPIVISIEKDDVIYFGEDQVDLEAFPVWLRDAKDDNPDVAVVLRADKGISYGTVIKVMDTVRLSGIHRIGMATQQQEGASLFPAPS